MNAEELDLKRDIAWIQVYMRLRMLREILLRYDDPTIEERFRKLYFKFSEGVQEVF
jgi:hypothetical protein